MLLLPVYARASREERVRSPCSALPMDARARTPRGARTVAVGGGGEPGGSDKEWRWRGWRAPARADVVAAAGFLATLTLLAVVSGGRTGSLAAFSSPGTGFFVQKPGKLHLTLQTHVEFSGAGRRSWTCFLCIFIVFIMIKSTLEFASMRLFIFFKKGRHTKTSPQLVTRPIIRRSYSVISQIHFGVVQNKFNSASGFRRGASPALCVFRSLHIQVLNCSLDAVFSFFFFYQHAKEELDSRGTPLIYLWKKSKLLSSTIAKV